MTSLRHEMTLAGAYPVLDHSIYVEGGMTNDSKIIDLTARLPRRFERVESDERWEDLCENAIIPALEICSKRLRRNGEVTEIQRIVPDTHHTSPFILLTWKAKGKLKDTQLALHFTYLGEGKVGFTISALRVENGYTVQAALFKELFRTSESVQYETVMHLTSVGLGYAMALDNVPAEAVWRPVKTPKDKMC